MPTEKDMFSNEVHLYYKPTKQTNLRSMGYVPCKIMQNKYCYSYCDIYTLSVKISFQTCGGFHKKQEIFILFCV